MNNSSDQTTITEKRVMDAIAGGRVDMRSVWYFRLRLAIVTLVLIIITLGFIWHSSFELFVLERSGRLYLLRLGWEGVGLFFQTLEWGWIIIGITALAILLKIIHRQTLVYRWPSLLVFGVLFLTISIIGVIVFMTPLHNDIHNSVVRGGGVIPELMLEKRPDITPRGVVIGLVTTVGESKYQVADRLNNYDQVVVTETTRVVDGPIGINDAILVIGQENNHVITADQILCLPQSYRDRFYR
jgi:membrane-associated PAP2 superfamily phosphatase